MLCEIFPQFPSLICWCNTWIFTTFLSYQFRTLSVPEPCSASPPAQGSCGTPAGWCCGGSCPCWTRWLDDCLAPSLSDHHLHEAVITMDSDLMIDTLVVNLPHLNKERPGHHPDVDVEQAQQEHYDVVSKKYRMALPEKKENLKISGVFNLLHLFNLPG